MKCSPLIILLAATVLAACSSRESREVVAPPDRPTDTTRTPGGEVQRAQLTITVQLDPEDSAVARALGWAGGRVPGAQLELQRVGSTTRLTTTVDASGIATVGDLLPGSYTIGVVRTFTSGETQTLADASLDVDALGGGSGVTVAAPSTSSTIAPRAGRRGSLVISELTASRRFAQGIGDYFNWQWVELYNNSDTTIYLDGKTLLKAFPGGYDYPNFPCTRYTDIRQDSLGIWGRFLYRFPGRGSSHPLPPGGIATLAVDALDHQPIVENTFDLTVAPFEFRASGDANNPAAADILSIGPSDGSGMPGGFMLHENREVIAIAEFVDVATLARRQQVNTTLELVRIPATALLDVAVHRRVFQESYPPCGESSVHSRFDRQDAHLLTNYDARSMQRRVLRTLPDGRKILQRTGTSSRDFEARAPTPFALP